MCRSLLQFLEEREHLLEVEIEDRDRELEVEVLEHLWVQNTDRAHHFLIQAHKGTSLWEICLQQVILVLVQAVVLLEFCPYFGHQ